MWNLAGTVRKVEFRTLHLRRRVFLDLDFMALPFLGLLSLQLFKSEQILSPGSWKIGKA
jgi:hypothetical protein